MADTGVTHSAPRLRAASMNAAMAVSYFLIGLLSTRLARRGIGTVHLLGGGMSLALLTLLLIITQATHQHYLLWIAYGLFSSAGTLTYASTAAGFPVTLSGRVNTVLNLFAFAGAFMLQWGMGLLIDALKASGHAAAIAHRDAFIVLFAVQAASLGWFFFSAWRARTA